MSKFKNRIASAPIPNKVDDCKITTEGERKTYKIFFRGEHPDNRNVQEWKRKMRRKKPY